MPAATKWLVPLRPSGFNVGMTRRRKPPAPRALTPRSADRHALYEASVQRPEVMIGFIEDVAEHHGLTPRVLREDFCGTANLAAHWAASGTDRRAIGIDLDAPVLDWAEQHNRAPLGDAGKRLHLLCDDVRNVRRRGDVLVSLNFSHFIYKRRETLRQYLRHAWRCLNRPGMLILDAFGGPASITPDIDRRNFANFTYLWEQAAFNPITSEILCKIHFQFPNGSMLRDAFVYDWRLWSLPELTELLLEAGFDDLDIYFESEDGFITELDPGDCDAWVAYLVAYKTSPRSSRRTPRRN